MFRVARLSAVPICELVQSRDGQQWTIWTATACAYACMKPADFPITYLQIDKVVGAGRPFFIRHASPSPACCSGHVHLRHMMVCLA